MKTKTNAGEYAKSTLLGTLPNKQPAKRKEDETATVAALATTIQYPHGTETDAMRKDRIAGALSSIATRARDIESYIQDARARIQRDRETVLQLVSRMGIENKLDITVITKHIEALRAHELVHRVDLEPDAILITTKPLQSTGVCRRAHGVYYPTYQLGQYCVRIFVGTNRGATTSKVAYSVKVRAYDYPNKQPFISDSGSWCWGGWESDFWQRRDAGDIVGMFELAVQNLTTLDTSSGYNSLVRFLAENDMPLHEPQDWSEGEDVRINLDMARSIDTTSTRTVTGRVQRAQAQSGRTVRVLITSGQIEGEQIDVPNDKFFIKKAEQADELSGALPTVAVTN
jgi:hypothetical protein